MEIVGTERRVSEIVRQRIPGHRTGNGGRPSVLRQCRGMTRWWRLEDRSRWRLATSNVEWQQFTRYWGALPWRHRWTVTPSLCRIHCGTLSQCSSEWSRCVKPRSNLLHAPQGNFTLHAMPLLPQPSLFPDLGTGSEYAGLHTPMIYMLSFSFWAAYPEARLPRTRTITCRSWNFSLSRPRVWNDVTPTSRPSPTTPGQFQSRLKTTLFHLAYGTWLGAFVDCLGYLNSVL